MYRFRNSVSWISAFSEIVSDRFTGLSRIEQHRLVYDVFGREIGGPIHALSLKTTTPEGQS